MGEHAEAPGLPMAAEINDDVEALLAAQGGDGSVAAAPRVVPGTCARSEPPGEQVAGRVRP